MDAVTFIATVLINPETGAPFELNDAEYVFLDHAFELTPDGRLRYPELLYGAIKKSGKTAFAAMIVLYVVCVLSGKFAEGYVASNDFEQSQGRVFQAIRRIVEASPLLAGDAKIIAGKITFASSGATITAIANDFASAAGANPAITVFDELWAFATERSHRFWDEMIPPPTRKIACRLTVTYAGFTGESTLLEGLYNRGLTGEPVGKDLYAQPGLLMFWSHEPIAPWQTQEWLAQMRGQHRPTAYLRQIENRWVTSESPFIPVEQYDECVTAAGPLIADQGLSVWLGVDASVKRDSTAVVACAWDDRAQKVHVVAHRIFQPSPDDPLDFESTVEAAILDMARRFRPVEVRYDPYQMAAVSQRLLAKHIPMVEFPQTTGNLTEASSNLYELIKGRNLVAYPDAEMRLAVQRSVAIETSRGWRIAKEKTSHKIDVVVALAQAALGAVHAITSPSALWHREALLAARKPVSLPIRASACFATAAISATGVAVFYWAEASLHGPAPLVLLDFSVQPFSPALFPAVLRRFDELFPLLGGYHPGFPGGRGCVGPLLFADEALARQAQVAGVPACEIDKAMLSDREALVTSASMFVGGGNVKLAEPAWERSRNSPLPLFDLRPDAPLSALSDAALIGIACSLPPELRTWERASARAA